MLEVLKNLNIRYQSYSHEPINSVREAEKYAKAIGGAHCKNLFMQDSTKSSYLAIILDRKKVDLKNLSKQLNSKRLSFASHECLEALLGVRPGCVTPLALINDPFKKVTVVIDEDILMEDQVSFHPLVNTETLIITPSDLMKFIDFCGQDKVFVHV